MYLWAISQLLPPKNTKSRTVWLLLFKRHFTELHSSAATYPVVHRGSWWSASNRTSSSDLRAPCAWLVWALVTGNGSLCSEPTPSARLNCVIWKVFMSHSMYFNHIKQNHFHFSVDKKNQLDVTFYILYLSSNSCSTCFGQPCAHHHELTTVWCYSLVLVCAMAAGRLSSPVGR